MKERCFLCLDFDGVIADGLDECLIVSWLAWHRVNIPHKPDELMNLIPDEFQVQFKFLRNFVRHDEHFIASYIIPESCQIETQHDFDRYFMKTDQHLINNFTVRFQQLRKELRGCYLDVWSGFHTLYDGIQSLFITPDNIFIVSGKDTESIQAILHNNNISIDKEKIFGGLKSKVETLSRLSTQASESSIPMIFCDDNLPNIIEANALGIKTVWANWGYHTEQQLQLAKTQGITSSDYSQLLSVLNQTTAS